MELDDYERRITGTEQASLLCNAAQTLTLRRPHPNVLGKVGGACTFTEKNVGGVASLFESLWETYHVFHYGSVSDTKASQFD